MHSKIKPFYCTLLWQPTWPKAMLSCIAPATGMYCTCYWHVLHLLLGNEINFLEHKITLLNVINTIITHTQLILCPLPPLILWLYPSGSKTLFNLTIASCECLTCWFSRRSRQSDPLQLEDNGSDEDLETRRMKEKLNFHFMNPFQKWRYSKRRRFPWKLLVQLISIVLVTTQVSL